MKYYTKSTTNIHGVNYVQLTVVKNTVQRWQTTTKNQQKKTTENKNELIIISMETKIKLI